MMAFGHRRPQGLKPNHYESLNTGLKRRPSTVVHAFFLSMSFGHALFQRTRGLLLTAYPELNVVNWLQSSGKRFGLESRRTR